MEYNERQSRYDDLILRWNEHLHCSFPRGEGGVELGGVCLVSLDADLAELVSAFIRRGELRPHGVDALRRLCSELRGALPHLSDESAKYFKKWEQLVVETLELASAVRT